MTGKSGDGRAGSEFQGYSRFSITEQRRNDAAGATVALSASGRNLDTTSLAKTEIGASAATRVAGTRRSLLRQNTAVSRADS